MYIMSDFTLRYISRCLRLPQARDSPDVYVNTLILCEVHVEVVKKSVLLFQKVSVSRTQTKSLTTKIHEMCNKV